MNQGNAEFVEIFLQEASDRLQFLREYSIILQDEYPAGAEIERLYIAAHTLTGTSASYGFPLFSQVAGKLAHIFQYAMNAPIAPDAAAPLLDFISEAVALLESDLIIISTTGAEAEDDISAFKQRYPFAFQETPPPQPEPVADEQPLELEESAPAQDTEVAVQTVETMPPDDEVSPEILEFFVPEAEEHLQVVTECLLAIESAPDQEQLNRLLRSMHTIKGSAAQVGLHRISAVAHRVEDLLGHVRDGKIVASPSVIDVCLNTVDVLKKFLYRQWQSEEELQAAVQLLFSRIDRLSSLPAASAEVAEAGQEGTTEPPLFDPEEERLMAEYAAARAFVAEVAKAEAPEKSEEEPQRKDPGGVLQPKSVRVDLERLDRMMNAVGELVINRTRMVGRISELERLADVLNHSKARMQEKVAEFQEKHEFSRIHSSTNRPIQEMGLSGLYSGHLRPPDHPLGEFTELEMDRYDDFNILSRSLTEISADITEVLNQLDGFVRRVDTDIDEFTKLAHRLQDEITQARMVPIGNLYTRLTRTVRDAAKAAGKRADLVLEGENTELDNNIIQQISDPLIHLVRNAVAHGIESDEARYEAGKSDTGRITVRAYHRGNHIFIEVEDDGGGIDYDGVRKLAVERGLVYAENASDLSEPELLEMLFQPG
ncbi:MAG TPA: Hpt domain-containing protein, partial [Candidatus Angelobacter sp.]|nr:Hpt domain-containing protein [Candidatus Angelobacter sp.]